MVYSEVWDIFASFAVNNKNTKFHLYIDSLSEEFKFRSLLIRLYSPKPEGRVVKRVNIDEFSANELLSELNIKEFGPEFFIRISDFADNLPDQFAQDVGMDDVFEMNFDQLFKLNVFSFVESDIKFFRELDRDLKRRVVVRDQDIDEIIGL